MQTYISSVRSVQAVDKAGNVDTSVKYSHLGAFGRIMGEMFDVTLLKSPTFIIVCVTGFIVYLGMYISITILLHCSHTCSVFIVYMMSCFSLLQVLDGSAVYSIGL